MSGSKKRKRMAMIHARVTAAEKAEVAAKAKAAGGISALFRTAVLGYKPPKSKTDLQAVSNVLAELGKIGSNVNQIAKHLNAGRPGDTITNTIEVALRDLMEMRHACMQALGYEPDRATHNTETER
ncbi:MAG: plasmid mobilization relaxosome protein MobC [Candidatus Sulfotelmatobacter sp.]